MGNTKFVAVVNVTSSQMTRLPIWWRKLARPTPPPLSTPTQHQDINSRKTHVHCSGFRTQETQRPVRSAHARASRRGRRTPEVHSAPEGAAPPTRRPRRRRVAPTRRRGRARRASAAPRTSGSTCTKPARAGSKYMTSLVFMQEDAPTRVQEICDQRVIGGSNPAQKSSDLVSARSTDAPPGRETAPKTPRHGPTILKWPGIVAQFGITRSYHLIRWNLHVLRPRRLLRLLRKKQGKWLYRSWSNRISRGREARGAWSFHWPRSIRRASARGVLTHLEHLVLGHRREIRPDEGELGGGHAQVRRHAAHVLVQRVSRHAVQQQLADAVLRAEGSGSRGEGLSPRRGEGSFPRGLVSSRRAGPGLRTGGQLSLRRIGSDS